MQRLYKKILSAVKKSTNLYYNQSYKEMEDRHKFDNDDVTNRDIMTQEYLQKKFLKLIPNSRFVGEEGAQDSDSEYAWIVDPIDGTFNFKHDVPIYGTQVCLIKNSRAVFSCLYLPVLNHIYYAIAGEGAYMNGRRIHVSEEQDIKDIGVCVGDYQTSLDLKLQQEVKKVLSKSVKRVRMFGSSCFDSCVLSRGVLDVYITYALKPWDLMPGDLLIREAGGVLYVNKDRSIYIYGNKVNAQKVVDALKNVDTFEEQKETIFK